MHSRVAFSFSYELIANAILSEWQCNLNRMRRGFYELNSIFFLALSVAFNFSFSIPVPIHLSLFRCHFKLKSTLVLLLKICTTLLVAITFFFLVYRKLYREHVLPIHSDVFQFMIQVLSSL